MDKIIVKGGNRLTGSVNIEGSKNAVLPILVASLLPVKGSSVLTNVPNLSDVDTLTSLLKLLGAKVETEEGTVKVDSSNGLSYNCLLYTSPSPRD